MKHTLYILMSLCLLLAFSCQKQASISVDECQKSYSFEAAGGTMFATVFGNQTFSVKSSQEWCYVQAYNPGADNNLRITARENSYANTREAVVTVSCEGCDPIQINVSQKPADAVITCDPVAQFLKQTDTDFSVTVWSNTDYTVSTSDWISFDAGQKTGIGEHELHFTLIGTCPTGETRKGTVTFTSPAIETVMSVEQAEWETIIMEWGFDQEKSKNDTKYIWDAFGDVKTAITTSVIEKADFTDFPRMAKADENAGFIYTNEEGYPLNITLLKTGEFKINKASSKTSKGNINRDGNPVERMQLSASKSGVGGNAIVFTAPRTGSLEIEAASPTSGEKGPEVMVDGKVYKEFAAGYVIPADITTMDITVDDPEKGVEVRIYSTKGPVNYFRITYTYQRPVQE